MGNGCVLSVAECIFHQVKEASKLRYVPSSIPYKLPKNHETTFLVSGSPLVGVRPLSTPRSISMRSLVLPDLLLPKHLSGTEAVGDKGEF